MNKSDRKFRVGDFVYVKTVRKYGEIKEVTKTPSGRTGYRLDINDLIYFEEEFEPTSEHEIIGKKFVDYITNWGSKEVSYFELIYNLDGTIDLVVYLAKESVEDEYAKTELIKAVAKLSKTKNMDVIDRVHTSEQVKWTLKPIKNQINIESMLNSFSVETEIIAQTNLMDYYLDKLYNTNDPTQKEQYKKELIYIVDQLKQLEYF